MEFNYKITKDMLYDIATESINKISNTKKTILKYKIIALLMCLICFYVSCLIVRRISYPLLVLYAFIALYKCENMSKMLEKSRFKSLKKAIDKNESLQKEVNIIINTENLIKRSNKVTTSIKLSDIEKINVNKKYITIKICKCENIIIPLYSFSSTSDRDKFIELLSREVQEQNININFEE